MDVIYCRMFMYTVTIITHVSNALFMMSRLHGDVMRIHYVRHFSEMQCFLFTCWTFTFQTVHSAIALYSDVLVLRNAKSGDYKLPKTLVFIRDEFFSIVVWPSTLLIATHFWPFFLYDRGLVYPADIDLAIPTVCNHIMHSAIAVPTLWEAVFRPRTTPGEHRWRTLGVLSVVAAFIFVLLAVYLIKGVWIYPIFNIIGGTALFYVFFAGISTSMIIIYHAQWTFNDIVKRSEGKRSRMDAVMHYAKTNLKNVMWGENSVMKTE